MGKKLFRFTREAGVRVGGDGNAPEGEAASQARERMHDLIQREYSPEQVALLQELSRGTETGARYEEQAQPEFDEVVAPEPDMLQILSEQTGLRMVDLNKYGKPDDKLRKTVSKEVAETLRVIPVEEKEDGTLVVAIADPSDPTIADTLRMMLGREVETMIASEDEINDRIEQYYALEQTLDEIVDEEAERGAGDDNVIAQNATELDLGNLESLANDPPIVKLVNILLLRAINERASDIHIEPFPTFIRIRYRVDGVLREIPSPPRSQLLGIISRIKVLATMNISESRLPQDGRIKATIEGREVDIRCSSMPTVHGEALVMRVLDKSMMMIGISQIGMLDEVLDTFKKYIHKPNGIVLVTGPTGCGKTTTLYASLAEVRDPGEKLITTEDPVEYEMDGIQQVNINENVGLTFARCLRAILRQDPDKVLVGEIRDVDTAQIAVQASLTGHLVFSTLHTNSAAATVTRLLDMGIEPFLITSALECVVSQRLVRTVCQNCKVVYHPSEEELLEFGVTPAQAQKEGLTFYHGEGCHECGHSGYHGRMGIFELLEFTEEVQDLVLERATTDEIHELALRRGMITMRRDGWIKVCLGLTTFDEVLRVTPREAMAEADLEDLSGKALEGQTPEAVEGPEQEALPRPAGQIEDKQVPPADGARRDPSATQPSPYVGEEASRIDGNDNPPPSGLV